MANNILGTSVGRKFAMALSALFLLIFLLQHFSINILSVFNPELFNEVSHFMGTNPIIQFVLQPILFAGIIFHFVMGFILEARNRASRDKAYAYSRPDSNSSIFSRYMLVTGATILLFLGLHIVDFFIPSVTAHHFTHEELDSYEMVVQRFQSPVFTGIYVLAFVFLAFHLIHGFQSAFQSVGFRNSKYLPALKNFGKAYAVLIPVGFIFIAVYHYFAN